LADAYLDEYKDMQQEIRLRIDLQHRNMNVLMAIITAVTGYVAKFASDHGVKALYTNDLAFFLAIVPMITVVFIWRHLDHDVNIIDKAAYINSSLRPALQRELGASDVLGWETFLHDRRKNRPRRLGPFLALGKEDVPMFFVLVAYLAVGWHVWLIKGHAGGAHTVFDVLLYFGSGFALVALGMAIAVGLKYNAVGKAIPPTHVGGQAPIQGNDAVPALPSTAGVAPAAKAARTATSDRGGTADGTRSTSRRRSNTRT
jgi:hypothetical protein